MVNWQEIPGNRDAFERLRKLLDGGRTISFVGAGASAGLYPLWGRLIVELVEETEKRGLSSEDDRTFWLRDAHPEQVVRGIKASLGEGIYADAIRKIFGPKQGPDGNHFTPIHAALLGLRIRGHITTNFDPGLLQARLELRPDLRAVGYATWKDADAIARWKNGDIFAEEKCPVLFAHGSWERSDSVVLGIGEYRNAYRPGAFRQLLEYLWATQNLLFAGFSFVDDWVRFIANDVLNTSGKRTTGPRHTALIGLADGQTYTHRMREMFIDQYDAEPLFYPVIKSPSASDDHSALLDILRALAGGGVTRPPSPDPAPPPGVPDPDQDLKDVKKYVEEASRGSAYGQYNLGLFYENGRGGLTKDLKEALRLYSLAADQGYALAQFKLGWFHEIGLGGLNKDENNAVPYYRFAADRGYAWAQNNLGTFYRDGRGGLLKDEYEAVRLYRLAAGQGNAYGQCNLGWFYESGGGGLTKDDNEAARLYRLSADQGNSTAQCNLGWFYESGRGGLTKDDNEAARLYRLSADQGNSRAQCNLGWFYENGRGGLTKDDNEAARLYRLSADQGHARAQNILGIFYRDGRGGLARNDDEAARLFRLSADQQYAAAHSSLGFFYEHGRGGLPIDYNKAVEHYRFAARRGNDYAQGRLKQLGLDW